MERGARGRHHLGQRDYIAATEDIAMTAKKVAISATEAISLNVGEGNEITIKADGTL